MVEGTLHIMWPLWTQVKFIMASPRSPKVLVPQGSRRCPPGRRQHCSGRLRPFGAWGCSESAKKRQWPTRLAWCTGQLVCVCVTRCIYLCFSSSAPAGQSGELISLNISAQRATCCSNPSVRTVFVYFIDVIAKKTTIIIIIIFSFSPFISLLRAESPNLSGVTWTELILTAKMSCCSAS